jgi:lysozyme family protein
MSNFDYALLKLMEIEGGFANNPADAGGMTYKGISRKNFPHWSGWERIDLNIKNIPPLMHYGSSKYFEQVKYLNGLLGYNTKLQEQVQTFYFATYWKPNKLDLVQDKTIAAWTLSAIVNADTRGARWAQIAAGVNVDGIIGQQTINALNCMTAENFVLRARAAALRHRLSVIDEHPSQKQFLHTWLSRDGYNDKEIAQIKSDIEVGRTISIV